MQKIQPEGFVPLTLFYPEIYDLALVVRRHFFFNDTATTEIYTLSLHDALPILSLSKHLAHNLGNLLLLGKIGVFHNRRNASSRLLLLISKHLILCIYLVFRILA